MSHKKLRPFIVKVSVLGYFPPRYVYVVYYHSKDAFKEVYFITTTIVVVFL